MTSWKKVALCIILNIGLITLGSFTAFSQQASTSAQEKIFEGTVKTAVGKYIYLPEAKGLDIIIAGNIEGGVENLVGKQVKVSVSLLPDKANLAIANSIELKDGNNYRNIYTRSGEPDYSDYFPPSFRDQYVALNITNINKPDEWQGKTNVKVYGLLQTSEAKQGTATVPVTHIVIQDKKGKEIARIIVNNITDYARFYISKLRLFDHFWFYLNVKDQVDRKVTARTKEIFSADVVFCGLY
ncbi:MAG TPA: hypothetical protein PKZ60_05885 [Candidatus Saccharicenans sp.]|nr:hypothetical protein [Candidatus Saccharicenans sp.]HPU94090.1 hypothetical protein [Candidatus Saccharicenans sp.]